MLVSLSRNTRRGYVPPPPTRCATASHKRSTATLYGVLHYRYARMGCHQRSVQVGIGLLIFVDQPVAQLAQATHLIRAADQPLGLGAGMACFDSNTPWFSATSSMGCRRTPGASSRP